MHICLMRIIISDKRFKAVRQLALLTSDICIYYISPPPIYLLYFYYLIK